MTDRLSKRQFPLLTVLLLAVAVLVVYLPRLSQVPVSISQDEAFLGLNASELARSGHGITGQAMPLYFPMFQSLATNIWAQPVLIYFSALFLKVLPFSEWAIRLPTVLVGLANVILTYLVGRIIFKRESLALVGAGLLLLTPAHFIHARVAMDYIYPLPFVLAWLLCMAAYGERPRLWLACVGVAILGLGFYSYIAAIAMMPVYFVITLAFLFRASDRPLRSYAAVLFTFAIVLLPAFLWLARHPGAFSSTAARYELTAQLHFFAITERVSLYWYSFNPSYLFLTGGLKVINSTRKFGVFLLPLAPLLLVGINDIVNGTRSKIRVVLLAGLLTAPLAACLVDDAYAIERELELLPFAALIAAIGVEKMSSLSPKWRTAAAAILVLTLIQFGFFYRDYVGDYAERSADWFRRPTRMAMEQVLALEQPGRPQPVFLDRSLTVIDWYWKFYLRKHGREDLEPETTYFDRLPSSSAGIPPRSLVIVAANNPAVQPAVEARTFHRVSVVADSTGAPSLVILQR